MIDTWTLLNMVLAFLCGSYAIVDVVFRIADRLAEDDDLNRENTDE